MSQTIAIVGAGLLGRLLAWRLSLSQHKVSVFEAGSFTQPHSAAHTAAAMVAPYSEAVISAGKLFAIGQQSLQLWPKWLAELNAAASTNIQFNNRGTIALAHHQDLAELQQLKQDLSGILGEEDHSQWLTKEGLLEKESELDQFPQALFLPDEAYLDNRLTLKILFEYVQMLGVNCYEHCAIEDCAIPANNFDPAHFDHVIDVRGVGAKKSLPGLRGVRGEVLWVHCPELRLRHTIRLMHPRYQLYLVPKPNNHYIIGATEIESEDLSPISVQSTLELSSALYTIHPAFAEARIVETDVNLRPAFADNHPRVVFDNNIIRMNGLHRHGYLLAPTMVDDVVKWINGEKPSQFWSLYS